MNHSFQLEILIVGNGDIANTGECREEDRLVMSLDDGNLHGTDLNKISCYENILILN
jgi:hypothetical protein